MGALPGTLPPADGGCGVSTKDVARCLATLRRSARARAPVAAATVESACESNDAARATSKLDRRLQSIQLHEQSVRVVANWKDTIEGKYNSRLAAQALRLAETNKQRELVDKEWAAVQLDERGAMISAAKAAILRTDSRCRAADSKALTMLVAHERGLQAEAKRQAELAAAERLRAEAVDLSESLSRRAVASAARRRNARERARSAALANKRTAAENAAKAAAAATAAAAASDFQIATQASTNLPKKRDEKRHYFSEPGVSESATKNQSESCQNVPALSTSDFPTSATAIVEPRLLRRKVIDEDYDHKRDSELRLIKLQIGRRRAEIEKSTVQERIARSEHIAQSLSATQRRREKNREVELERIATAHAGELEARLKREAETRQKSCIECQDVCKDISSDKKATAATTKAEERTSRQAQLDIFANDARRSASRRANAKVRLREQLLCEEEDAKTEKKLLAMENELREKGYIVKRRQSAKRHDHEYRDYVSELTRSISNRGLDGNLLKHKIFEDKNHNINLSRE